jgi:hypothetical protein
VSKTRIFELLKADAFSDNLASAFRTPGGWVVSRSFGEPTGFPYPEALEQSEDTIAS